MKVNRLRENKGITLVALVITIIVLIILAGVSINAVFNDGIIENAKAAKDEFNRTAKEEEQYVDDLTLKTSLNLNGLEISNGLVTGIKVDRSEVATKVGDLEGKLPKGCSVVKADGNAFTDEEKESTKVGTGMKIVKDGAVMSTIVIYGDIDCDGDISSRDSTQINRLISDKGDNITEDYQIIAADFNCDGYINKLDAEHIKDVKDVSVQHIDNSDILQNKKAGDANRIVKENLEVYFGRVIDSLDASSKLTKTWDSTKKIYNLSINTGSTVTAGECIKDNAEDFGIKVYSTEDMTEELTAGRTLVSGNVIAIRSFIIGIIE